MSALNGSNSSSSVSNAANNNNLVATNVVIGNLSSLNKSSPSSIVAQHSIKYDDDQLNSLTGNYPSLTHQSTHSQLNHSQTQQTGHLIQDNGTSHLLNNSAVDSLASQHLASSYHTMNQLSTTSSMAFHHPLSSNVYASKSHLSPSTNGFITNSLTINNGYNQFNPSTNQINSTSGYDLPVWHMSYDMSYPNNYSNFST